jgi:hypothetical protein
MYVTLKDDTYTTICNEKTKSGKLKYIKKDGNFRNNVETKCMVEHLNILQQILILQTKGYKLIVVKEHKNYVDVNVYNFPIQPNRVVTLGILKEHLKEF